MIETRPYRYCFGEFELVPCDRALRANAHDVRLSARAFDVLVELVARHGQLVTKSHLLQTVWSGLVVEENNLQVQIAAIRRAIGRQGIATVPRYGYRFTMPVSRILPAGSVHASE
ncbi:MAG TPA: winged helix-turn-helix domain-containing protein [Telluria sp.]|nr:winged helix-turn-helix domain-containing protein [Telluria sp.]